MPVQCLVRRLTRAQIEKTILDKGMQDRLALQDAGGTLLLVVTASQEAGDPEAHAVLQTVADADAAIMARERAVNEAAEAKALTDAAEALAAAKRKTGKI